MINHRRHSLPGWVGLVLLAACLAHASSAVADDAAAAREAYAKARKLFEDERYTEAAAAFREANRLNPNWKIYYNIGQCEALAKRHGLALEAFEAYLSQGGDELSTTRKEEVLTEVDRLQKIVGMLDLKAPPGALVVVDGVERETTPLPGPLMIAAGVKHALEVRQGEEVLLARSIKVSGGKTVVVDATAPEAEEPVEDVDDPSAPPEPVEPEEPAVLGTVGWITLAVGGALAISGGITGGMALSINGELEDDCPDEQCGEGSWSKMDRMDRLATASNVLLIGGGVLAATGAVLLIVDASGGEDEGEQTALVPSFGPGRAGLALTGRF